jgi:uncharacterized protein (TIGR00369 family)
VDGFAAELGAHGESVADGEARFHFDATDTHLNRAGTVHGGVLATLADAAMALAARSRTGEEDVPATSQLTVAYLSPGRPGPMVVSGEVRKQGDHVLLCEADIEQDGRALVHAVATFALV